MNPAEFLIDLANGNINAISVPSELEDKVEMGNSETETRNGKPTPAVVHEVRFTLTLNLTRQNLFFLFFFSVQEEHYDSNINLYPKPSKHLSVRGKPR